MRPKSPHPTRKLPVPAPHPAQDATQPPEADIGPPQSEVERQLREAGKAVAELKARMDRLEASNAAMLGYPSAPGVQ